MKTVTIIFIIVINFSTLCGITKAQTNVESNEANSKTDTSKADESKLKKNAIYTELMGNCIFYSFNYERILLQKQQLRLSLRAGISFAPYGGWGYGEEFMQALIPLECNILLGKQKSFFETGFGHTYNTQTYRTEIISSAVYTESPVFHSHFFTFRLGYRYQKPSGRFLFKIAFIPYLIYRPDLKTAPNIKKYESYFWGGIACGYAF